MLMDGMEEKEERTNASQDSVEYSVDGDEREDGGRLELHAIAVRRPLRRLP